jgi:hypothetical protein
METSRIDMDPQAAKEALRAYRQHKHPATHEDELIMRAYRAIARGKVVIRAFDSVRQAGFDKQGLPRLALIRADVRRCICTVSSNRVTFRADSRSARHEVEVPWEAAKNEQRGWRRGAALVPIIPLNLRPKASALSSYHILWEADWTEAPVDPLLLKRLQGDLWVVVAAWDLSPVERAIIAERQQF